MELFGKFQVKAKFLILTIVGTNKKIKLFRMGSYNIKQEYDSKNT